MKMQSNTAKFDLMKIIKSLDRDSKVSLVQNWDNLLTRASSDSVVESLKKESKLHDPETAEHLIKILDLLEKFLSVDEDISLCNICLFIEPMISGSRKITLRPYRIISLINRLYRLAKRFEREYGKGNKVTPELRKIKTEFKDNLKEIRTRLMSLDNEIVTTKKPVQPIPEFSLDRVLEDKLKVKIKKSNKKTASKISDGTLANTIDQMVQTLQEYNPVVAQKILDQTTYGYGDDFDKEVKKEILSRLQ